jgi:putative nucleotidyltransferase with HDIG domain
MRRILFVDDQPDVLNAHRESLKKFSGQVEPEFVLGGKAALDIVRSRPVDVLVADMHMPEMDGPELLRIVKDERPDVVRLMLCPTYELESTYFALMTVHQVLAKPLDVDALMNAVDRTCQLRGLLTDSLRKKIGAVGQLPPIPGVYLELTNAMTSPNVSNSKIARIIEKDAPMAAKTLQLVNSACFGLLKRITSLEHAVSYLGLNMIRDLSLTVHVFAGLERTAVRAGFKFASEQEHSLMTAKVAKRVAPNRRQAENAFTAGLLHDIGKLVLAVCIPEKFAKVQVECRKSGRPSFEVEAEFLGVTHAEVGAYLLGLWGLPYPIVEAVAYHHNPGAAMERTFDLPTTVSIANALVEEITRNKPVGIADHLNSLKLADKLPAWTATARQELQQVPVVS